MFAAEYEPAVSTDCRRSPRAPLSPDETFARLVGAMLRLDLLTEMQREMPQMCPITSFDRLQSRAGVRRRL